MYNKFELKHELYTLINFVSVIIITIFRFFVSHFSILLTTEKKAYIECGIIKLSLLMSTCGVAYFVKTYIIFIQ